MQPHSGRLERVEVKAELRGFGVRCWLRLDVCGGLWSSVIGDFITGYALKAINILIPI